MKKAEHYELVNDVKSRGWGAKYFPEDEWTPVAQVFAAVTMLGPLLVECIICERGSCDIHFFNGRPSGTGVLAYALLLPGSLSNHLACAVYRKWIPIFQKADRIGCTFAVVLQCWATSQNTLYTGIAALLSASYVVLLTCSPSRFRDDADTATLIVGATRAFLVKENI